MAEEIIIVGAGAHSRVVFDILRAEGKADQVTAFVDAEARPESQGMTLFDKQIIPSIEAMDEYVQGKDVTAIIGHGNNSRRKELLAHLESIGVKIGMAIHPTAIISPDVEIGPSTTVSAGVVIVTGAWIGKACIINTSATVDHDCEVGDFTQIAPGAHLAGRVQVGPEAFVGIGAVVIQNVIIGAGAVIGASAAVVRDVPERCLVIGVPARVRKRL
jgi:sugar O-acyltransferase (sialic acid O-acetyltransferase NeuD family)